MSNELKEWLISQFKKNESKLLSYVRKWKNEDNVRYYILPFMSDAGVPVAVTWDTHLKRFTELQTDVVTKRKVVFETINL